MKTILERDTIVYAYLESFEKGYSSGDFSSVFKHLDENCVMESQWVLTPNEGYEAVVNYLIGKGETLKRTGLFPSCSIVELTYGINPVKDADFYVNGEKKHGSFGLAYDCGELCLLMEQTIDDKTNGVMLRIKLTEDYKIARIDLCDPELFQYRDFYTFVSLYPAKGDEEINDGRIRISEPYYPELYLFLAMAEEEFDEYYNTNIPMDKWIYCLEKWKRFYSFKSFDEAFEDACGIDYGSFTVNNQEALSRLSDSGKYIWANRQSNPNMIYALIEWTEKYKNICDNIMCYGF